MKKKLLSLLLCLVMALSLLPTVAFAADIVIFPLFESGYYDASGNWLSETPSDNYVRYDAETKTITMKNVAISDSNSGDITVFKSDAQVKIVLIGSNSITISEGNHSVGIETDALEITSEDAASLDITVEGSTYAYSHAIRCTSLTVSGKAKVSCSADFEVGSGDVYGIRASYGKITMKDEAQLEIIGAKGATADFSWEPVKLNVGEGYDAVIMMGDSKATATEKTYSNNFLVTG